MVQIGLRRSKNDDFNGRLLVLSAYIAEISDKDMTISGTYISMFYRLQQVGQ